MNAKQRRPFNLALRLQSVQATVKKKAKVIKLDILGGKWSILDNAQDEIIIKKDKREEQLKDSGHKAEEIKKILVDLQVKIDDLKKKKRKSTMPRLADKRKKFFRK